MCGLGARERLNRLPDVGTFAPRHRKKSGCTFETYIIPTEFNTREQVVQSGSQSRAREDPKTKNFSKRCKDVGLLPPVRNHSKPFDARYNCS